MIFEFLRSEAVKRWKIIAISLLFAITAYFIWHILAFPAKSMPPDFWKSRNQAALIARNIVELSVESNNQLKKINDLDRNWRFTQALNLVRSELERNKEMRNRAIELSGEVEKMARLLPRVKPVSARAGALQALNYELALMSRLITYNDYLNSLLEVLRVKFARGGGDVNGQAATLVQSLNAEALAINDLNNRFNQAMTDFENFMK